MFLLTYIYTSRHIKGNWLAFWRHEIGRSDADHRFDFKQIHLQSFLGRSNGVKSIRVLDNENSFVSCSKDRTVKLWSIKSQVCVFFCFFTGHVLLLQPQAKKLTSKPAARRNVDVSTGSFCSGLMICIIWIDIHNNFIERD